MKFKVLAVAAAVSFLAFAAGSAGPGLLFQAVFRASGTGATDRTAVSKLRDTVSVKDFGAVGDGVADDTTAIQNAINAAHHVYMPGGKYKITATLLIDDRQGQVIRGDGIRGSNNGGTLLGTLIQWAGNSTDPAIKVYGSSYTTIRSLKILASSSFPLDTGIRYETKTSRVSTHNNLRDVFVGSDSVLGSLHYGVRFIAGSGGNANNDQGTFDHLTLGGYDTVGFDMTHSQSCDHRFFNLIMGSSLGAATYGIQGVEGNTFSVYGGGGGGHSGADFHVNGSQFATITIMDFHVENSAHFFVTNNGGPANVSWPVTIIGSSFTAGSAFAADGRVIDYEAQGPLTIIGFAGGTDTSKTKRIHFDATGLSTYNFTVIGLSMASTLTNVFSSAQPTFASGIEVYGAGFNIMREKHTTSVVTLTYGVSVATDAGLGNIFVVTATNGVAFAIAAPTNPVTGQNACWVIRNTSGGALGALTWNAAFKTAAFTNPATANSRSNCFYYNGTNWIQTHQSAADVPN